MWDYLAVANDEERLPLPSPPFKLRPHSLIEWGAGERMASRSHRAGGGASLNRVEEGEGGAVAAGPGTNSRPAQLGPILTFSRHRGQRGRAPPPPPPSSKG